MKSKNNFNRLAHSYDGIARLVFGNAVIECQVAFASLFRAESKILILGGGSGRVLELLPSVREVDYVEKSEVMIRRARRRNTKNDISFINQDFFEWETDSKYDFIVCPFFLDCFNEENLGRAISKIKKHLKPNGLLLVTDFEPDATPRIFSALMHFLFWITVNLESKKLKAISDEILLQGFDLVDEKFFHQNMIFSRVYRNL